MASADALLERETPISVPDPSGAGSARAKLKANAAAGRGSILKYKADRWPVTYVLTMFAVHVLLWWAATPLVALLSVVPLTIASMFVAPINHHHQHLNTFRSPLLNRLYDLALGLQTGIGPYGWVLHHNLGHHLNYLNQRPHERPDESKWTRRDGSQMGRVEYTAVLVATHQIDIFRVGRKHPKVLRAYLLMKIPLYLFAGIGLYLNPLNYLLIFLIPGFLALVHTSWATYEHHAGCDPETHHHASRNRESKVFNVMTGNLGLHTAHHMRPGVHWSLLPAIHEEIRDKIPPEQLKPGFWN